jgi:hypothetical protein
MKKLWAETVEAVMGRRSLLGIMGKGAFGLTVGIFGIALSGATVHANECTLCVGSTSGCSDNCHEDGEVCSWGWTAGDACESPNPTAVCFECFWCGQGWCGGNICSEKLCF